MKKSVRFILPIITLGLLVTVIAVFLIRNTSDIGITCRGLQVNAIFSDGDQKTYININTATAEELDLLPGIGPSTAEKIIAYRNENGPFRSIEEILNVSGIGPKTFEAFKSFISVR